MNGGVSVSCVLFAGGVQGLGKRGMKACLVCDRCNLQGKCQ